MSDFIEVRLSHDKAQYLSKNVPLAEPIKRSIEAADAASSSVRLSHQQVRALLDAVGTQLQRIGFDENYDPTPEGELLEGVIDILTRSDRRGMRS